MDALLSTHRNIFARGNTSSKFVPGRWEGCVIKDGVEDQASFFSSCYHRLLGAESSELKRRSFILVRLPLPNLPSFWQYGNFKVVKIMVGMFGFRWTLFVPGISWRTTSWHTAGHQPCWSSRSDWMVIGVCVGACSSGIDIAEFREWAAKSEHGSSTSSL